MITLITIELLNPRLTATAVFPYTTECSPCRITLPGADTLTVYKLSIPFNIFINSLYTQGTNKNNIYILFYFIIISKLHFKTSVHSTVRPWASFAWMRVYSSVLLEALCSPICGANYYTLISIIDWLLFKWGRLNVFVGDRNLREYKNGIVISSRRYRIFLNSFRAFRWLFNPLYV